MLKITILAIGSIKESYIKLGIEEYQKRLSRFVDLTILELPEAAVKTPHEEDIKKAIQVDGAHLKKAISQGAYVIILDRQGQVFNNETLAKRIDTLQQKNSQLVLVIGGSHGVDETIVSLAKEKWSFSALTFPHQLFRLFLLEQIYRSMTILKGHPYHK
jgi:23S rRNA (pseudouridine1915-N3)-methyltransferase